MRTVSTAFSGRFGLYSAIPQVLHCSDVPCISGVNSGRAARTPYSVPFSGHMQIALIYNFSSTTEWARLQGFRFCFRLEYFNCRFYYVWHRHSPFNCSCRSVSQRVFQSPGLYNSQRSMSGVRTLDDWVLLLTTMQQ